jgi:tRNA pseudouridine55 synthase
VTAGAGGRPAGADGILLIDKPAGMTSHDVVNVVRRALGVRRVGHAGTLDPMATGLLVIGAGRATRLLRFLSGLDKSYRGTGRLGEETDTLDADGRVIRRTPCRVARAALDRAVAAAIGSSLQAPPAYSAVKVAGVPMHASARRGVQVEAPPRRIRVDDFRVLRYDGERDFDFVVTCSSGTYVRVLVADVGRDVDCGAHLIRLRRTRIGPFDVVDASPPDDAPKLLPLERAVAHLPRVRVSAEEAVAVRHGRILGPAGVDDPFAVFSPEGRLLGVYRDDGAKARPEVILAPAG